MMRSASGAAIFKWMLGFLALVLIAAVAGMMWAYNNPLAMHEWVTRTELGKAGLQRLEVEAAGSLLVAWRGGDGADLVLLHGSGDQAGAWSAVVPRLLADYRVHVLDLPGHGDSEPAEGPLMFAEIYGGLEAYLATLEGPPVLVGNSMGAWLATIHAHRHPEGVARIVLVNGGALFNPPREGLSLVPANREEARNLMQALRDPSSPPVPDFLLDDIVQHAGRGPIGRMMQDMAGMVVHLLDGKLGEVTVPVDLLWGASDRLIPPSYAERMAAELPAARLTLIERCGHIPMNECPERFVERLRELLAREPPAFREGRGEEPTSAF